MRERSEARSRSTVRLQHDSLVQQVTFNGTPATVTTSSTTLFAQQCLVCDHGSIIVTTPSGRRRAFGIRGHRRRSDDHEFFTQNLDGTSALTINGTNFDAMPANDRVNLNVAFATPTTASATNLSIAVPRCDSGTDRRDDTARQQAADFFVPPQVRGRNVQFHGPRHARKHSNHLDFLGRTFAMRCSMDCRSSSEPNFTASPSPPNAALYDPTARIGLTGLDSYNAGTSMP